MGPVEETLKAVAEALDATYELVVDPATSASGAAYSHVKFRGARSKRYAVLIRKKFDGRSNHSKSFTYSLCTPALTREEMAAAREETAAMALESLLSGNCIIKLSKTRHVRLPAASSADELRLRLAVAGGRA